MMTSAGGGGDWFTALAAPNLKADGPSGATTTNGDSLPFGSNTTSGEDKNDIYFTSSGETIQVFRSTGPASTTGITGFLVVKYDTDGTIIGSKAFNTMDTSGTQGTHPRLYPYGSTYDTTNDFLYVVGYSNYTNVTGYGSAFPGVAKIDGTDLSLDEYYVYPTNQNIGTTGNRGWFEDCSINKNNNNLMCTGVFDIQGVGYRNCIWEINPSTMAQVNAVLIGSGGAYGNCIDTDSSGNIYLGGYDAYGKSSLIKFNSSYIHQWNKDIDSNGQLVQGLKVKGNYLYVLRRDAGILSGYGNFPVAMNKFDLNGTNQWTTYGAHADSGYNGFGVTGFDFDSNGDIIITHLMPNNYRALTGANNTYGFGFTKLNDSDGDYNWTVSILPYVQNTSNAPRFNPGGMSIKDGRIAAHGQFMVYTYEGSSNYMIHRSLYALNVPEDLTSMSFTPDNDLFPSADVPQLSTATGTPHTLGLRIDDVSSYFNTSGPAQLDSGSVTYSVTTLTSGNTAPTDFLSSCRYYDITPDYEVTVALA